MKKLLLTTVIVAVLATGPSMAADLGAPVYRAPPVYVPPVVVPVFNWTGFYIGGNVGYGWGKSSNAWNVFAPNFTTGDTICMPAGGAFCPGGSDSDKLNGAIGGLQAGYNWQNGNSLAGIETDFQASGQKGDQLFTTGFVTLGGAAGTASATY